MSALDTTFIIEVPVISTAALAVLAYFYKRAAERDAARDKAIAELTRATAVLVEAHDGTRDALDQLRRDGRRQFADIGARQDKTERSVQRLREETAVLSALLERSERNHPMREDPSGLGVMGASLPD